MANYTPNYNFTLPIYGEIADVQTLNNNFTGIDEKIHNTQISLADAFDATQAYEAGDVVMYETLFYVFTADKPVGVWDGTKARRATAGELLALFNNNLKTLVESIAAPYDGTETYNTGDVVSHEFGIWECNTDNTTGTWDSQKWDPFIIAENLGTEVQDMTGATSSTAGAHGLAPAPAAGDEGKYLRGDGTWNNPPDTTYSDMTGATSSTAGAHGLAPAPAAGDEGKYLKGDGTWGTPPGKNYDAMVAEVYDETKSYSWGDIRIYNNGLYRSTGNTTGVWDATKWQQITIGEMLEGLGALFENTADIDTLAEVAAAGNILKFMQIGDQTVITWMNGTTSYDMPLNLVAAETVKDENNNDINVATYESEYVLPFDTVYDAPEAIFASAEDLAAGEYYFKIVNDSWGGNNGKYVSFTLDADLTAGKQIRKKSGAYNAAIEDCTLGIFTDGSDTTGTALAFTVSSTQPATGTSLGQTDGTADLNYWHCVVLGYNRWMYSAIRQFLNSDSAKNNWWVQQHKWDVMPAYATTADGFLKGMDPAVLAHIKTTEVKTVRNTVFNSGDTPLGGFDTTFDKIFLAALEQMYIQPQESGEGTYWPYYKELLNVNSPVARGATYPELKKYDLAAKTTSRYRWLRSCRRGDAYYAWYVNSSGYVTYANAISAVRCAPCLRIG